MLKSEREDLPGTARHFIADGRSLHPHFLLEYTFTSPAARLADIAAQGGNFSFRFDTSEGWFYRVESRHTLESGAWATLTNVPAGPANTIVISVPINPMTRFYRVIAE